MASRTTPSCASAWICSSGPEGVGAGGAGNACAVTERENLGRDDLERQAGDLLPDREALSVIDGVSSVVDGGLSSAVSSGIVDGDDGSSWTQADMDAAVPLPIEADPGGDMPDAQPMDGG